MTATMPPPHPSTGLVMPASAVREMQAPRVRPSLPPGTRTGTPWVWLLATLPWLLSSTIFFFDVAAVLDALWVDDVAGALSHVTLHVGLLVASTLVSIAIALVLARADARHLGRLGVVRPFPWGFAAIAAIVYLIGRTVVLRGVARPTIAPLVVSAVLYAAYYIAFGIWASVSVADALQSLASAV